MVRNVKKWVNYVDKSLARQPKRALRRQRQIERQVFAQEISPKDLKKARAELSASVAEQRVLRKDHKLFNKIVIDTAIKELGFNQTLSSSALRNLHLLSNRALMIPLGSTIEIRPEVFGQTLTQIIRLIGDKPLAIKFLSTLIHLREAYNKNL
ncbi:MAG: hypothetical protein PHD95_00195 [Candidatus ainarchaeum sp.]|nr:hypothetical protein [Candidatus ainarchaeum sp.]